MVHCAIKWCGRNSKSSNVKTDDITFHRFPADTDMKAKWIKLSRRENWTPTKASMVCSRHFTKDCFQIMKDGRRKLYLSAIPSKHLPIVGDVHSVNPVPAIIQPKGTPLESNVKIIGSEQPSSSASKYMLMIKPITENQNNQSADTPDNNKILCSRILHLSAKVKLRNKQLKDLREKVRYYKNKVVSLNGVISELREMCPVSNK